MVASCFSANPKSSKISTLSMAGCSLDDNDLSPVCETLKAGIQLTMLKLSGNRVTDAGVTVLVEAILKNKNSPLSVLDLSNNRVGVEIILQFHTIGAE